MSIHKLTAGSGYDYLTRQVAALDATDKGHVGLASYYTEKGETPGVWVGSGMAGIDGLDVGDVVTADHMQNLFGAGLHPLATDRTRQLDLRIGRAGVASPTEADYRAATRLGAPFRVHDGDVSAFRVEVAKRLAAVSEDAGLPGDWAVPAAERAKVRTEVARELFRAEHGRDPLDARELAATIAKHSRPKTTAVAGYDLTFSPVKSVSVLWALADPTTGAIIERAHRAAVQDALDFIEAKALYTRMGTNGVRQVDVRGLVGTAFTHRDSRAGDPDLHTHVAIANKVQVQSAGGDRGGDSGGKWLAIDGRVLFKATVAASETYNTALERHLVDALGVRFEERPGADPRKRPVREIVGVDSALNVRFAKRRASVEARRKLLVTDFQAMHGRPPTPVETIHLAQQATLKTREAKHEPRSLTQQRAAWFAEAVDLLGSPQRVRQTIHAALHPATPDHCLTNPDWFTRTADRIVATLEGNRAIWQYWHVYAEAQRQARAASVPGDQLDRVVGVLVDDVLTHRSISLARPAGNQASETAEPAEPKPLRRADGSSMYAVAGADMFTSRRVVEAEARLVAAAGRTDGFAVDPSRVEMAMVKSAANGVVLNPGQATLVHQMATSGARVQLAIAPAGSGKTTAMRALANAWTAGGGTIIGLAPSAAAADALQQSMGSGSGTRAGPQTDTLAKLDHSLRQSRETGIQPPAWVRDIGPSTLVVIDEAGMADTVTLDNTVSHVLACGGSVRLVGDDQQLAAIGAGGVLRDIRATHGALQLSELVRFKDPAEGAASLALRDGRTEALGFYLDRGRVHIGDLATMTEDVLDAWGSDRASGLDSIMLAPTRDLVAELNRRARVHRLKDTLSQSGSLPTPLPMRTLADGNDASVGDVVLTRTNDRRLRTSATDWVKNGDRWTVQALHDDGALIVQHTRHNRTVRLPRDYVDSSTELGYACTVHTAQGVTADTMHGLATGAESRQQIYTMMTRGAHANHVYLEMVGDGDPHSVIHPTLVHPLTATDVLERILSRDDAQHSATSTMRDLADPATRLGTAAQRYLDSLYVAADHAVSHDLGVDIAERLDEAAESLFSGLCDEPAWPTLRAHLILLGATGEDPVAALHATAADRELVTAEDRAAVLDWRLDESGLRNAGAGPLPWMPAVPARLKDDPQWGGYLTRRAALVTALTQQVHDRAADRTAAGTMPDWAQNGIRTDDDTVADVDVWRAAMQVSADDRRPTGPPQLQKAAATWQRRLDQRVAGQHSPALAEWQDLLDSLAPQIHDEPFTLLLAQRLAAVSRAGLPAHRLLRSAMTPDDDQPPRPLPDEHAAAALWWRMVRHVAPAVAAQVGGGAHCEQRGANSSGWMKTLTTVLGTDLVTRLETSPWWSALVANIDHARQRGWPLETILNLPADGIDTRAEPNAKDSGADECQALVWRTSIVLDPVPRDPEHEAPPDPRVEQPPDDLWQGVEPGPIDPCSITYGTEPTDWAHVGEVEPHDGSGRDRADPVDPEADGLDPYVEGDLARAAYLRDLGSPPLEPTEADIRLMLQRAEQWDHCPVDRSRMVQVNDMAQSFFETHFASGEDAWGRDYLMDRFGVDLAGHDVFRPGQAPAGWTTLADHLRSRGVTDTELLTTGLASQVKTGPRVGQLIDRFRDRVMFPIVHRGDILGFVGRRHPDLTDEDQSGRTSGPKYLNTADTPLFHKGAQLFGVTDDFLDPDVKAVPIIVEGPMDAVAVTLASAGRFVGVSPLGTALTQEQAAQLADICRTTGTQPIVATDADTAGQVAAERDFWMLTPHSLDPGHARFPTNLDPAGLLAERGPAALVAALVPAQECGPKPPTALGDHLLAERLDNLPPNDAMCAATRVLAARPSRFWAPSANLFRLRLGLGDHDIHRDLRDAVADWDEDPRRAAQLELNGIGKVHSRLSAAGALSPVERWKALAHELDPALPGQTDWPLTAASLQQAHDLGYDVRAVARELVNVEALARGADAASDLRYRLTATLEIPVDTLQVSVIAPRPGTARDGRASAAPHTSPRPNSTRRGR